MEKLKNDTKMKNDFNGRDEDRNKNAAVMIVIGVIVLLAVTGGLGSIFGAIGGLIGTIFGGIGSLLGGFFGGLGGLLGGILGGIGGLIGAIMGAVGAIIGAVFGLVGGIIGLVFGLIGGILGLVFGALFLIVPIGLLACGAKLMTDNHHGGKWHKVKRGSRLESNWRGSDDDDTDTEKIKNDYI